MGALTQPPQAASAARRGGSSAGPAAAPAALPPPQVMQRSSVSPVVALPAPAPALHWGALGQWTQGLSQASRAALSTPLQPLLQAYLQLRDAQRTLPQAVQPLEVRPSPHARPSRLLLHACDLYAAARESSEMPAHCHFPRPTQTPHAGCLAAHPCCVDI